MNGLSDEQQRDFEAAAFRRLVRHLRERSDVQNIDLMNLAGFSRRGGESLACHRSYARRGIDRIRIAK